MRTLSSNYQRTVIDFCKEMLHTEFGFDCYGWQVCVEPDTTTQENWNCVFMRGTSTITVSNIHIQNNEILYYGIAGITPNDNRQHDMYI